MKPFSQVTCVPGCPTSTGQCKEQPSMRLQGNIQKGEVKGTGKSAVSEKDIHPENFL